MTASSSTSETLADRAFRMSEGGLGTSDIALILLEHDNDETRAEVRKLIEQGRAKALGAH